MVISLLIRQKYSWRVLALSPIGNIVREGHYEDDEMFKMPFIPEVPLTHAYRQHPETEVVQFERQFRFAYDGGFKGILLVKHTTNPETINFGRRLVEHHSPEFQVMF